MRVRTDGLWQEFGLFARFEFPDEELASPPAERMRTWDGRVWLQMQRYVFDQDHSTLMDPPSCVSPLELCVILEAILARERPPKSWYERWHAQYTQMRRARARRSVGPAGILDAEGRCRMHVHAHPSHDTYYI